MKEKKDSSIKLRKKVDENDQTDRQMNKTKWFNLKERGKIFSQEKQEQGKKNRDWREEKYH